MSGKLVIFFLVAVALVACIGSAAATHHIIYTAPVATSYYHPYGYTYPLTYNYRFGAYPYLFRR